MPKTFVEKLMSRKAGKEVAAGAIVSVEPDYVMSHDNAAAISNTFKKIGVSSVKYPDRVVIILDHSAKRVLSHQPQRDQDIRTRTGDSQFLRYKPRHMSPGVCGRRICHAWQIDCRFRFPYHHLWCIGCLFRGYWPLGSGSHLGHR